VHFIETPVFTRQITTLLDDADYRQLQVTLALKPGAGDIIRGSGGLRKVRWAVRGRGKSGGIRVIYYLVNEGKSTFSSPTRKTNRISIAASYGFSATW
jgi:mRNA-degrading endonuclease RelE of RelBE toxin-antitoxin system